MRLLTGKSASRQFFSQMGTAVRLGPARHFACLTSPYPSPSKSHTPSHTPGQAPSHTTGHTPSLSRGLGACGGCRHYWWSDQFVPLERASWNSGMFSKSPLRLTDSKGCLAFDPMSRSHSQPGAGLGRCLTTLTTAKGLRMSEEVREAVHAGKPVVALESTIITHGMPHPFNEETALGVEQIIRESGALPATVGVLNGTVCVGLSDDEIRRLADTSNTLVKISRRDLPVAMAQGLSGGTTVSATMIAAHAAGIPIFATGGIGGVHRGVEETSDVSADLRELGRTPVAVVCAGVKSILDIPRTLEYLETEGVCVVAYGSTTDFPAFFAPRSGCKAPYNVQSAKSAADIIDSSLRAGLGSGLLFAVPIPGHMAASGEMVDAAIQTAVEDAQRKGVKGREVTPFVLDRLNQLTKGATLTANIALVKNNARVAAEIAVALSKKRAARQEEEDAPLDPNPGYRSAFTAKGEHSSGSSVPTSSSGKAELSSVKGSDGSLGQPVVIGGAVVDFCAKLDNRDIKMDGATYRGQIFQSFGGVGRNIADCMSRLGNRPLFISALGKDMHATGLMTHCAHMDLRAVHQVDEGSTPTYCPVLTGQGFLLFGIGDMDLHSRVSPSLVSLYEEEITRAPIVCVDGNFSSAVIERVGQLCAKAGVPLWFEPTDVHKAARPGERNAWRHVTYVSPNLNECAQIWSSLMQRPPHPLLSSSSMDQLEDTAVVVGYCRDLLRHIPVIMVTMGREGLILARREEQEDPHSPAVLHHYPAAPPGHEPASVVSVSGAGDCLNAAMMHFITQGHDLELCVKAGLMAAQRSLQSHQAVPESITAGDFTPEKVEDWARFTPTPIPCPA